MWRLLIVVGFVGCINQAAKIINPPPEGGGTQTCAEIVETCDASCTQPLCLRGCSNNGTTLAAQQHDALLSCGERNSCTDEACMRASCPGEIETCQGVPPTPPAPPETPPS